MAAKGGQSLNYHAFVISAGKMVDLNTLIPAKSGWVLQTATGINDAGQIVGYGTFKKQTRGFLLTPASK
jgi:probable HAF family extracellular repeat protein